MRSNWKYCLRACSAAERLLELLGDRKETGGFIGCTYAPGWCHTCFTPDHCAAAEKLIADSGVDYQRFHYYDGDLDGDDFSLPTFGQPLVQWCPAPIYSLEFEQRVAEDEPWGLSMEGRVLLGRQLRRMIDEAVKGLRVIATDVDGRYDAYEIVHHLPKEAVVVVEGLPAAVDCQHIPEADIFAGARMILCSLRLARMLKRDWKGSVGVRFQPIECQNVTSAVRSRNRVGLVVTVEKSVAKGIAESIATIERGMHMRFPSGYLEWVTDLGGELPPGWLSPIGGMASELVDVARQEHEQAEPAMPTDLVPLYAYGNGDHACLDIATGGIVDWEHETGSPSPLDLSNGFLGLLGELS